MIDLKECPLDIMQKEKEINDVITEIIQRNVRSDVKFAPNCILEIGSFYGGSLWIWNTAFFPKKMMSIDYPVPPSDGRYEKMIESKAKWPELFKDTQFVAIDADSHKQETIDKVKKEFPDGIDFCFIDGDHSYDGCLADYKNYLPLMKKGSVMAFHDIARECKEVWQEIKKNHEFIECLDGNDTMGIGLIIV